MRGLAISWIVGERKPLVTTDSKGRVTEKLGKNGGPIISQKVVKVLTSKVSS